MQQLLSIVVICSAIAAVSGDYQCVCSYHVELGVYTQASGLSSKLGHMYEFDCKPLVTSVTSAQGWQAVAFEHQLGYVETNQQTITTVCQGTYPDADKLTTSAPTTTTTTTTTPPTTTTPTTTTTTTTTTATATKAASTSTQTSPSQSASSARTVTSTITTTDAMTTTTTPTPTQKLTTTTTSATLTTTQQHIISGNTSLCPAILNQYTQEDKAALTQYDQSCYELVPIRTIWYKAENDCRAKGGHLFHISNQAEQDFIYQFITSYKFDHAVWSGLHDLRNEEYFEWISGDHLIYTNWYSDRLGNMASHHLEDCVLFVPYPPYFGKWDDVVCGSETVFGNTGQQNPFICQYPIHPQPQRVTGLPMVGK